MLSTGKPKGAHMKRGGVGWDGMGVHSELCAQVHGGWFVFMGVCVCGILCAPTTLEREEMGSRSIKQCHGRERGREPSHPRGRSL